LLSRYLIFGIAGLTLLVQSASANAVAVAFPEITSSFNASIVLAGWVLSVFQLAMIVSIPVTGKAADALGRKRTFMSVLVIFTVGAFLCAIAPNIYWLILFRAIQGVGAGGFLTSAAGIVADTFPRSRQRCIGLITSIATVGVVLGPNVGGWLTESFGWRSNFWFAIPWGVVAFAAGMFLLKKDGERLKAVFDLKGAAVLALALVLLMVGLTTVGRQSSYIPWLTVASAFGLGLGLMIVFVRHERRAVEPMLDLEMFSGRRFMASNMFNFVFGLTTGGFVLLPLYAVTVYGASTIQSGLVVTPRAAAMMAASFVTSFMLIRWGYRKPMLFGTVLMVAAAILLGLEFKKISLLGFTLSGIAVMPVVIGMSGFGHGFIAPAANNACIELMPDRVSTIMGLRQTLRHVGGALGIAIASVVLASAGSLAQGFQWFFLGIALISLVTIPFIFAMPRSPSDVPASSAARSPVHAHLS